MDATNEILVERDRVAAFPALAGLGFIDSDLAVLARQGFLGTERRRDRSYFKLRYRRGGYQHVKYVGSTGRAAAVQHELERLQSEVRTRRELAGLVRDARQVLRASKSTLKPLLESRGFRFHGLEVRQRQQKTNASCTRSSNNSLTRK